MKKKLLIYAHYYYPDVASTGQILQDLAEEMKKVFEVIVICTVPSYTGFIDNNYKDKKLYIEYINGVKVIRVSVPEFKKNNKFSRIKNITSYFIKSCMVTKDLGQCDYVFTISQPPILGGILGVLGKVILKAKLIYCIQDFNPEQIEASGYIKFKPILGLARWIDNISCKKSDLIITVGRDLCETLKKRFKYTDVPHYVMINNWIDEKKIYPLKREDQGVIDFKKEYGLDGKFIFMYSGNIGLYYDLDGLLRVIENFKKARTSDGRDVAFVFVGDGSVLESLKKYKNDHFLDNVFFIPYQEKTRLIYSLNAADVHFCVNAKGIKGVSCPSKFYGILSVGKPVLGVLEKNSEVELLIRETECGKVCEPGDYDNIAQTISWFVNNASDESLIKMGMLGHEFLIHNLSKDISVSKYLSTINSL